jgi:hypothetical protein
MISYSQVADIAADLDLVVALLSGEKVPVTSELATDLKDARESVRAAGDILRALPIEVVEQLPTHLHR